MVSGSWGARRYEAEKFLVRLAELGPPASLFLAGPEVLLRDEILGELRRSILGDDAEGRWSREVYQAREVPLAELSAGLRNVGLFAESRLVVVTEVERYGRSGAADRTDLWGWMQRPSPGIHLALCSEKPLWELERSNEFVKGTLRRADALVPLEHPSYEKAVQTACRMAQERHGMTLPAAAAQRLVDAVGPNLLEISNEIDRLGLRLGAGAKVSPADLENWLRTGVAGNLVDLEQAILRGDAPLALRYWASVKQKFNPPTVTWMLGGRHLDARWGRGGGGNAVGSPILVRLLRECYRLERAVKRGEVGSGQQEVAFEAMILKLCQERHGAGPKGRA
jgi:DNA polymerase III delta subunit